MKRGPWRQDHNPAARPLGCNRRYGYSGRNLHVRAGETVCPDCRESANHAARERRRGQPLRRTLRPCGTRAAAQRHRERNEPLDLPCKLAEAAYHADLRATPKDTAA